MLAIIILIESIMIINAFRYLVNPFAYPLLRLSYGVLCLDPSYLE